MGSFNSGSSSATVVSTVTAQGDVAVGVVDSGNPIKIGGYSTASIPTPVTNGQRVNAWFDQLGRLHTVSDSSGGTSATQGQYNTTAPTLTNGQTSTSQLDVNANAKTVEQYAPVAEDNTNGVIAYAMKPLAVSTYSWTRFQNLGANATLNVKASAGNVFSLFMSNVSGAMRFAQLHNTATVPAGAAVPIYSFPIMPSGQVLVDAQFFGANGMNFATGIAFACSTTEATYTAATATDHNTYIQYK